MSERDFLQLAFDESSDNRRRVRGAGWGAGDIVCSQNILFCYKTDMFINGRVVGEGWVRPRVFSGTAISWAMENKFR